MLIAPSLRVFLATAPCDMRRSFDGLGRWRKGNWVKTLFQVNFFAFAIGAVTGARPVLGRPAGLVSVRFCCAGRRSGSFANRRPQSMAQQELT
jgi:hypothetical protein